MSEHSPIEEFEERAAIIEYDAQVPRRNAESAALREIRERYGLDAAKQANAHAIARRAAEGRA